MDKKQRITTVTTFCLVLFFAFLTVAYALIKGPSDIYASLEGEQECNIQTGEGCVLQDQKKEDVSGFYQPENISNYVDVPGVSGKLFGVRKGGFGLTSFVPSGPTALALLTTPIVTGDGGKEEEEDTGPQVQQLLVVQCDEGEFDCNGTCIPEEDICQEEETTTQEECDPQVEECAEIRTLDDPQAVPEPATMLLFGTGLAGAALRRKFQA